MRQPILRTMFGAAFAVLCACAEPPAATPPHAVSAERYASPAAETAQPAPHGYSADSRRVADCLASYPSYDVRTDQVQVSPGVTRPCPR